MSNETTFDSPVHFVPATPWLQRPPDESPAVVVPEISLPQSNDGRYSPEGLPSLQCRPPTPIGYGGFATPDLARTSVSMDMAFEEEVVSFQDCYVSPALPSNGTRTNTEQVVPSTPIMNTRTEDLISTLMSLTMLSSPTVDNYGVRPSLAIDNYDIRSSPDVDSYHIRSDRGLSRADLQRQRLQMFLSQQTDRTVYSAAEPNVHSQRQQHFFIASDDNIFM